ncbi:MAG TPA: translation initiation factor IF-2 [Candidatus Paceibacterota bacterium]|nr:translation initiation factor IF-2 [Candidatus Paceibacterota bacterium]
MARVARPPVIAVMGHIDHGKSTLLDYIRKTNSVANEAGGITQHVSAYIAEHNGRRVTFLDTPGHEAFKALRTRGAAAADIAILVVAADEGVMPQTEDALAAITDAGIPYLVAITKIDKNNADVERAKNSLLEHGIYLEGLGGDIAYALVSSKTGEGVPELLDLVLLAADLAELTADTDAAATGFVLESMQDPKRGASATLIVKDGTLGKSRFVVAGDAYAPVRYIEDFRGERIEAAGPSEPARISGFSSLPAAGTIFTVVKAKKEAEALAAEYAAAAARPTAIAAADGGAELPLVIKADVAGSVDAILHELEKVTHERAALRIVATGVGNVSEGDVKTAAATGGVIIAFNAATDPIARELALRDGIRIESFSIIYELSQKVAELLAERAPSVTVEEELGRATVIKTFSSSAKKQVIGARLDRGAFAVGNKVKIMRGENEIGRGTVANLQQARADVKEIRTEGTFGTEIEARADAAPSDVLIAFAVVTS